ncbi:MAG: hypothetical protein ACRDJW_18030 [Thermomicrobiales bacterium]
MDWEDCATEPETTIAPELTAYVRPELTFAKLGYAGIPETLGAYPRDLGMNERMLGAPNVVAAEE